MVFLCHKNDYHFTKNLSRQQCKMFTDNQILFIYQEGNAMRTSMYKDTQMVVRVNSQTRKQLETIARRNDSPVSHVVRTAVREYLNNRSTQR